MQEQQVAAAVTKVEVAWHRCSGTGCTIMMREGSGRVPELSLLYHELRGTQVDRSRPLTRSEVLSQEKCPKCAASYAHTYPTKGTLSVMELWAGENAARKNRILDQRAAFEAREHRRSLAEAIKREDSGINRLFDALLKPYKGHKKTRVRSKEPRVKQVSESKPEKPNKKKGKQQSGNRKKGH